MLQVGLRVDADTLRGTRDGVPRLLELLARYHIRATFFFSVGPDNMGRHLWRLYKPAFLYKMLRTRAPSLYGWKILLAGTAWPGRLIGQQQGPVIRDTVQQQHEVGLHAWDHYGWQTHIAHWSDMQIRQQLQQGLDTLQHITGQPVQCSAAPGWRTDMRVLQLQQPLALRYHSDCRGYALFRPQLTDGTLGTPQIPVTLPTFDELLGGEVTPDNYHQHLLARLRPQQLNVYTIHAEVEGLLMAAQFDVLLQQALANNIHFCPLGELLTETTSLPAGQLKRAVIAGREGWIGCQQ